jgi:hypothetical protein
MRLGILLAASRNTLQSLAVTVKLTISPGGLPIWSSATTEEGQERMGETRSGSG